MSGLAKYSIALSIVNHANIIHYKKYLKKVASVLACNEKATTFAPAFREGVGSSKRGERKRRRRRQGSEHRPFEKNLEKVLGGNGKGITFAVRFREERDRAEGSEVL